MGMFGIAKLYLDGVLQRSDPGATLKPGGEMREPKNGHAYYGPVSKVTNSELTATIQIGSDFDLDALRNFQEGTIRFESDNGIAWVIPRATVNPESIEISDDGGGCQFTAFGAPAEQE